MHSPSRVAVLVAVGAAFAGSGCGSDEETDGGGGPSFSLSSEPITQDSQADLAARIEVDAAGHAHVVWTALGDGNSADLWYADNGAGSWATEQLSPSGAGVQSFDFTVDDAGVAHVLWADLAVHYRQNSGGSFSAAETVSLMDNSWDPSITTGMDGTVYAAWSEGAEDHVVQAVRTGATWSTSNIGLSGLDGNPVIAVGGLGVPQVCWVTELGVEYSGPNLLWAAYDYDEWNIQLVSEDNAGQVIDSYECIADVGGHIHIAYASYVEAGRSEVYYVTNVTGQVERINVSNAPDTNDHSVHLAVDGDSVAHLTWVKDGSRDEIHYAKVAYDEIETEETISTTEDRTRLAPRVAVEPNGAAHIVWWERTATEMSGYQPTFWVSYWSNAAHMPAQPIAVGQAGFSLEPDISVVGGDPQIVYDTYLGEEEASRDLFFATGER